MTKESTSHSEALQTNGGLLVDARTAARICSVSLTTWRKLNSIGKTPEGIKLGRRVLWNRLELERWVNARCPSREEWLALQ